jgi:hypothetical protein
MPPQRLFDGDTLDHCGLRAYQPIVTPIAKIRPTFRRVTRSTFMWISFRVIDAHTIATMPAQLSFESIRVCYGWVVTDSLREFMSKAAKARWDKPNPEQRTKASAKAVEAAKGYWENMSKEERSEEMKRRAAKRKKKQR